MDIERLSRILGRSGDDRTPEPKTVPEAQNWLRHHGFHECSEARAQKHAVRAAVGS